MTIDLELTPEIVGELTVIREIAADALAYRRLDPAELAAHVARLRDLVEAPGGDQGGGGAGRR